MKRKRTKYLLAIVVLFISVGFAVLTANLGFNGEVAFKDNTWDIHFENIQRDDSSIEPSNLSIDNKLTINFTADITRPGDYLEFYVDLVNAGTLDGTITSIKKTELSKEYTDYLDYQITYFNDEEIKEGDILRNGNVQRLKVHVGYKYETDEYISIPTQELSFSINFEKTNYQDSTTNKNIWKIAFTGKEQVFIVPKKGKYKLEVWGAQGGSATEQYIGGYGAYATGTISKEANDTLYINVGGAGNFGSGSTINGGYNGGAVCFTLIGDICGSGGGATHIATESGLLSSFESKLNKLLIVSAGGGGSYYEKRFNSSGASGGGITGNITSDGTCGDGRTLTLGTKAGQNTSGTSNGCPLNATHKEQAGMFGQGGKITGDWFSGGGAGLYGGGAGFAHGANGGSSYIANSELSNKSMYCYDCEISDNADTKTVTTKNVSKEPKSQYAKIGNGHAKITYLG